MIPECVAGFASDPTEEQGHRGPAPVHCPRHSDRRGCGTSPWIVRALFVSSVRKPQPRSLIRLTPSFVQPNSLLNSDLQDRTIHQYLTPPLSRRPAYISLRIIDP